MANPGLCVCHISGAIMSNQPDWEVLNRFYFLEIFYIFTGIFIFHILYLGFYIGVPYFR